MTDERLRAPAAPATTAVNRSYRVVVPSDAVVEASG
jgi:hypothetical protein